MRIIARSTLRSYVASLDGHKEQSAVETALEAWFARVEAAKWVTSADIKAMFVRASIVSAERVVFDIKGNDYRLVAAIDYEHGVVYIKWIGTHKEYDKIDVRSVSYVKK